MLTKIRHHETALQTAVDASEMPSSAAEVTLEQARGANLLTVKEAAAHLRVSKSYLDKLRVYGGGPPFLRLGVRKIVYRRTDLDAWAAARRFGSTSEYARP
jgi:excisionase family DNA binding protein